MTHEERCSQVLARVAERREQVPVIDSPAAAQWAVDEAKSIKSQRESIEALLEPGIKAAHEAHKRALAARDRFTKPMAELERAYTREVLDYQAAQREQTRVALAAATAPSEVAAAVAIITPPPVGLQERNKPWQWALVSLRALVEAVARDEAPIEFLTTADGAIGKVVRTMKDTFRVAGIKTWVEKTGVLK